jgi:tRNA modification GTPase
VYILDTIAAVSTPPGNGGIGIVRVSGSHAVSIADTLFKPVTSGGLQSHRFYFGSIFDPETGYLIDEAMAVIMRAPRSYTREDVLELHCHGGMLVVEQVLALVLANGSRLADPGEFTRRAFLNGRIDLVQAEAVMDIISSQTNQALHLAQRQRGGALSLRIESVRSALLQALAMVEAYIDFPEDDLGDADSQAISASVDAANVAVTDLLAGFNEGRILREGISVLIVGKPNTGKSSLLNRLLNENRAIVTHLPGTTRDIIEETLNLGGLPVRLLDTAGIRHTHDLVESEGIARALDKIPLADLILFVLDSSRHLDSDDLTILDALADKTVIAVLNKSDCPAVLELPASFGLFKQLSVSAFNGDGLNSLKDVIRSTFLRDAAHDSRDCVAISHARQRDALESSRRIISRVVSDLESGLSLELLAVDLREALAAVGSITGQTTTDDVLDKVFSSFCIGK